MTFVLYILSSLLTLAAGYYIGRSDAEEAAERERYRWKAAGALEILEAQNEAKSNPTLLTDCVLADRKKARRRRG